MCVTWRTPRPAYSGSSTRVSWTYVMSSFLVGFLWWASYLGGSSSEHLSGSTAAHGLRVPVEEVLPNVCRNLEKMDDYGAFTDSLASASLAELWCRRLVWGLRTSCSDGLRCIFAAFFCTPSTRTLSASGTDGGRHPRCCATECWCSSAVHLE